MQVAAKVCTHENRWKIVRLSPVLVLSSSTARLAAGAYEQLPHTQA